MNGKELIKHFEGCKLKAYLCPAGIPTIGYGHTKGVFLDQTITQEQADKLLEEDFNDSEKWVQTLVRVTLKLNQLEALTSFVFNVGPTNFKNSTLLKKLNLNDFTGAANEFDKWVFAAGKKLDGLIARRAAEKALFKSKP